MKKRKGYYDRDLADIDEWYNKKDSSLSSNKKDKCLNDETSSHYGPEIKIESLVVEQKSSRYDSDSNHRSKSYDTSDTDDDATNNKNESLEGKILIQLIIN